MAGWAFCSASELLAQCLRKAGCLTAGPAAQQEIGCKIGVWLQAPLPDYRTSCSPVGWSASQTVPLMEVALTHKSQQIQSSTTCNLLIHLIDKTAFLKCLACTVVHWQHLTVHFGSDLTWVFYW